jgi:hypothetical protein
MFWLWIVIATLVIVAFSVLAGKMLSRPRQPQQRSRRQQQMMGLKASGAFPHRKSNRP